MKNKIMIYGLLAGLALASSGSFARASSDAAQSVKANDLSHSISNVSPAGEIIHVTNTAGSSYLISGDTLTIRIPSNPGSTGYKLYLVDSDGHYLTPVSSRFIAASDRDEHGRFITGRQGVREFSFKIKPALLQYGTTTTLKFAYLRPWTSIDPYAHCVDIKIHAGALLSPDTKMSRRMSLSSAVTRPVETSSVKTIVKSNERGTV